MVWGSFVSEASRLDRRMLHRSCKGRAKRGLFIMLTRTDEGLFRRLAQPTHLSGLIIHNRLTNLLLAVHDERPIADHGFIDRLTAE